MAHIMAKKKEAAAKKTRAGKAPKAKAPAVDDLPESVSNKKLDTVLQEPVSWLWPNYIPHAALSLLDGDPDLGKSTITLDWAARVSNGSPMPPAAGRPGALPPGAVLLLSAEDDLRRTIKPRLAAAGADMSRIHQLESMPDGTGLRPPVIPRAAGRQFGVTEYG